MNCLKKGTFNANLWGNFRIIQEKLIDDCVVVPASDLNVQAVYGSDIYGLTPNPAYSTLLVYKLERNSD